MDRYRNFAFVLYPESQTNDWVLQLEELKIPTIISPLHDLDYTETGQLKKAHHHIIFKFDSVKTVKQVLFLLIPFHIEYVEPIQAINSYERYLCHLDSIDKTHYNKDDVVCLNGATYLDNDGSSFDTFNEIIDFIDSCKGMNVAAFIFVLKQHPKWVKLCTNYSYLRLIELYLKG